ncbi:MAG TPA: hypothetical protein VF711_06430, partial [Acidimicrobiales bacterium]
ACKSKSGRWVVTQPVGSWALQDVEISAHSENETWRTHHHIAGPYDMTRSVDTIKVTIEIRSEARTLKLEGTVWEGDRLTEVTVDALLVAAGRPPFEETEGEDPNADNPE